MSAPLLRRPTPAPVGTGEQGSVGMHLSFQTQQELTVFIWQEVGKTVAKVWKKNIQDKG